MRSLVNKYKYIITVLGIGVFLSIIITFPVILSPSKIIFGYSGDNFGNTWYFWWQKYASTHSLNVSMTPFYNAPVGVKNSSSLSEFFWTVSGAVISNLTNEVLSFNLLIYTGFFLSFIFMYALVYHLTKSRGASIFGGLVFAISPYHYWQATAHLSLSLIFWLPLFVLSLFYFDKHKTFKSAFFVSAVFLCTIYTTFYYGFFCALITASFFLLKYIFDFKEYFKARTFFLLIVSGSIVLLGFIPLWRGLQAAKEDSSSGYKGAFSRKLDELVGLSARPWDYFIYPPNHPVFGRFNKQIYDFIQSKGNDFKVRSAYLPERVVFLGIINILLALLAAVLLLKKDKNIRIVMLLLFISFVISMPPYFPFKGITFYTPSYLFYQFFPFIRVYARMGVFVLLFTTLLSAFFVKVVLSINRRRLRQIIYFLIFAGAIFEFLPDFRAYTDLRSVPQVYQWLSSQPGNFIIAEYPEAFDLQAGLIFQRFHEKPLFNMPSSEPRYGLWKDVADLGSTTAYVTLKKEGVRYVVYHLNDLAYNPYDDWRFFRFSKQPTFEQERNIELAGFKKIIQFPEAIVYEL